MAEQPPPFTGFVGTAPGTASFASAIASLMDGSSTQSVVSVSVTAASSGTLSQSRPTTFSTLPASSQPQTSAQSQTSASVSSVPTGINASNSLPGSTAPSATSLVNSSSASKSQSCNSISCSPGLQAAVAVPIVIGVVIIIGLMVFIARRRKNKAREAAVVEEKPEPHWTRHLHVFSFDNEHLTRGRFSGRNSSHSASSSRQEMRHAPHTRYPGFHGFDAAPSYKDAMGHSHGANMNQAGTSMAAGGLSATANPRSGSRASAPPPYGPSEIRPYNQVVPPVVLIPDPFSDSNTSSPVNGSSPFGDPSLDDRSFNDQLPLSRGSSMRSGPNLDDASSMGGSEAGSVHEAQVGRHVSVISTGRVTHIRTSSQSPPSTD